MSLAIDPVTDYQRSVGRDIATHRALNVAFPQHTSYMRKVLDLVNQHRKEMERNTQFKGESYGDIFNQLNNLALMTGYGKLIPTIPFVGGTSLGVGNPSDIQSQAQLTAEGLAQVAATGDLFRPETIAWVQDRYNQALEERGYLKFKFFNADKSYLVIPFFENPQIQETRQAKYAVNEIMNRNEPYRLFTGAQPRQIRLSFKMTLPHIMIFSMITRIREAERIEAYDDFWKTPQRNIHTHDTLNAKFAERGLSTTKVGALHAKSLDTGNEADVFYLRFIEGVAQLQDYAEGELPQPTEPYNSSQKVLKGKIDAESYGMLEYVQHMVDTIRSSVIAASNDGYGSLPGPPLAYLKFGTLFDEDQFTVESYDLKFDGKDGYDNVTLLPRVIEVSLNLKSFGPNSTTGRGTALGWDSAFVRLNS